jgi:hypothetical protein
VGDGEKEVCEGEEAEEDGEGYGGGEGRRVGPLGVARSDWHVAIGTRDGSGTGWCGSGSRICGGGKGGCWCGHIDGGCEVRIWAVMKVAQDEFELGRSEAECCCRDADLDPAGYGSVIYSIISSSTSRRTFVV